MDYKELVERLNEWNENLISELCADDVLTCDDLCGCTGDCIVVQAATAITDLLARAEAAEARVKKLAEAIEREQRRAEKAEKERDAAVSALETVMAYGGGNLDTCQFCKNGQCYVRGGTKLCLPKWRGKKED